MAFVPASGAKRLRQLLQDPNNLVVCPGVYDGITARVALAAGFEAIYMTGAGTSMSRLGWADLGMATFDDMSANAEMIASLNPNIPLIADADTGYGGPVMVARTVAKYARAGVAGLHIEDQVTEKRCGHLLGKVIVDREVYYSRLRAAVMARDQTGSDIVIIARTDSRQSYGMEEALIRLKEAVEIGVDAVFLEALQSDEECQQVIREMQKTNTPVLLNSVAGGNTPNMSVQHARELGFRIMIHPALCIGPVVKVVREQMELLRNTGIVDTEAYDSPRDMFNVCGLQECMDLDKLAGGKAYSTVNGKS